jgi:hypothetical protein
MSRTRNTQRIDSRQQKTPRRQGMTPCANPQTRATSTPGTNTNAKPIATYFICLALALSDCEWTTGSGNFKPVCGGVYDDWQAYFQLPELQCALSNRQSRSRSGNHRASANVPRLRWPTSGTRRQICDQVFLAAKCWANPEMETAPLSRRKGINPSHTGHNLAAGLARFSVWLRFTIEHGLFGQFVVMNREIVEQDGRMAARHFYCQFVHLGRADAPMFQIACDGRGHWGLSALPTPDRRCR